MIKVVEKPNGTWVVYENDIPKYLFPKETLIIDFSADNKIKLNSVGSRNYTDRLPLSSFQNAQGDSFATLDDFINYISADSNQAAMSDTGFGFYRDTQYDETTPFVLQADTDTTMPNNAGIKNEDNLPSDVTSLYNSNTLALTPKNVGDSFDLNINFKAKTAVNNTWLKLGVFIGGALGLIFPNSFTFPRGTNVEHEFSFVVNGFAGSTFVPNQGIVKLLANQNIEIYDISYVVLRYHKSVTHIGVNPI